MIFFPRYIRATAKDQYSEYFFACRSQLIAISVVNHLLFADARSEAASRTSIPALLSRRRFVVDVLLVRVSHILPKALHRSLPQGILRAFPGALVASGREGSRSRWRTFSFPSPSPSPTSSPTSSASPPSPPPPPSSCSSSSDSPSSATTSPSPWYSTTTSSPSSSSPSSPALFQGCYVCFVQHVGINIQAIITTIPFQNTIVQATFQSSVYLQKKAFLMQLYCVY